MKSKPSKVELKSVIEALKDDPTPAVARKALKYIPHYVKSQGLIKKLLKEIIRLWSESGEQVRVVCLLCLVRIYSKIQDKEIKQLILKKLYSSFLVKCRITKPETMSMIAFMRHSLIELYRLDPNLAFKQAQTSCQQLAITLKNAYNHKNEETYKTVLNWQFANCLILLSSLVSSHADDSPVKALTHQVIQLNLGAINFLTSPRYYPFYCHLIDNLISLSVSSDLFIPILPLILNIITRIDCPLESRLKEKTSTKQNGHKANSKTKYGVEDEEEEVDMEVDEGSEDEDEKSNHDDEKKKKVYNIDILNHVSLEESKCPEFTSAVLQRIYEIMVRYLADQSHKIAFPELVFLPSVQIKKWLRRNPGKPAQQYKNLLEKIKTDVQKVEEARKSVNFAFNDFPAIDAWQKRLKDTNRLVLPKLLDKIHV